MNEISFSFLSRVHIWSTYLEKIHLAANEIIFRVIRGYNETVRILVISNLCTYFAIIGSAICAINIWNSFPIAFNLLDNDYNIPTIKRIHKISYQKGKRLFANNGGIKLIEWGCTDSNIFHSVVNVHIELFTYRDVLYIEPGQANLCLRAFRHDKF